VRRWRVPIATSIDDLIPKVLDYAEAHRDEFLAEFERPSYRMLARAGWWIFVGLLPAGIRAAYAFYLQRFASMSIAEFLEMITRDLKSLPIRGVPMPNAQQFDWSIVLKFGIPLLQAAIALIPAGNLAGVMLNGLLALLLKFVTPSGVLMKAQGPPMEMPPEDVWTPEGLTHWYKQRAEMP
jgi:hypothetical protein